MKVMFLINFLSIEGEPMGVMQLSSIAKSRGWETSLCLASDDYLRRIDQTQPDLLAVSMMTTDYRTLMPAIRQIRKRFRDLPIIVGGAHPTFSRDLIENEEITAICVGEGDTALIGTMERIAAGKPLDGIPNLCTKQTQAVLSPLIEDLDQLPFLDREILYDNSSAARHFRLRSFYASRGCPYGCTYCFNHAYNRMYRGLGKIVRRRSVGNVLAEIDETARRYPTDYVRFSDDAFVHRVDEWLEELARDYPKQLGIPFYCLVRANCVTPDMVRLLKEAGCRSVCMSIESASARIREEVLNRKMTTEQIVRAFDLFNHAGIKIYTNSMFGLPSSNLQDEIDTLDLNIRCRPAYSNFTICVPFPGTEMFDYCKTHGFLPTELSAEEMVMSVGEESMLSGFSSGEKRVQKNLAMLGPLVVKFPWLKKLVTGYLVRFPPNKLYGAVHFILKNYLFKKHIVPIRFTLKDYFVLGYAQLRAEIRLLFGGGNKDGLNR
ncbi:MAG: radical SAM protein [Thermodesulfobacteriota bacterium]